MPRTSLHSAALLRAALLCALTLTGCGSVTITDLDDAAALDIKLAVNAANFQANLPGKLKFWVDITNRSGRRLSLERLKIELRTARQGTVEPVLLRQAWTYRHNEKVFLEPDKRLTVPIVPERAPPGSPGNEFPLELLPPGAYEIVAVVNEKHLSKPCALRVQRPDLGTQARR
jgi:hypothetical protein